MTGLSEGKDEAEAWARTSDTLDQVARVGLIAYGIVHLVIGWLAVQLALGDREGSTSSDGALAKLAQQPFGGVLVWAISIGLFLLAAWQATEAAIGHQRVEKEKRPRKRLVSAGRAVLYIVIGVSGTRIATGSGSGGGGGTDSMTAKVMDLPGGQILVGLIGLGVLIAGGVLVFKGVGDRFLKDLEGEGRRGKPGTAYVWLGRAGYSAKGVAIGMIGVLFGYAAITHEADKSGGMDAALLTLLKQPFGPYLLGLVGLGFVAFGLFCFAWARHLNR